MGSKGSAASTITNSTTSPDPQAWAAYQQLLQRAQGVSQTPYTPYGGELVAPINSQQNLGINNINANAGFALPYINQAAALATSAAQPISDADIQRYINPYTQSVVDSAQNQFNNQNTQQQQQLLGNAISRGSLGGNRTGIAQAELANQQSLAQSPVIANLYNQGYSSAVQTALAEQQAKQAGAYSIGNLGVAGQNAGLTGANAQIGAGALQQQTSQADLASRYQQFMNQQAYPFQTAQWLAGIDSGIGGQMGGSTHGVTTPAQPSMLSQYAGAALGTAGLLGQTGLGASIGSGLSSLFATMGPAMLAMLATGGSVSSQGIANPETDEPVPETEDTLQAQQQQLLLGHRRAQMFPHGSNELQLPEGMGRVETDNGVFHYDPKVIDDKQIKELSSNNRENELLDLGPFNKQDILSRIHNGEMPIAIVERTPKGVEVRAAAGTMGTVALQIAAMERTKSPNNRVTVEDIRNVTESRRNYNMGGAVRGFADGGVPEMPPVPNMVGGLPYAGARSWVPSMGIAPPKPIMDNAPKVQGVQQPTLLQQAQQVGQLAKTIQGGGSSSQSAYPQVEKSISDSSGDDFGAPIGGAPQVPGEHRGGVVRGFAGGGEADIEDSSYRYEPQRGVADAPAKEAPPYDPLIFNPNSIVGVAEPWPDSARPSVEGSTSEKPIARGVAAPQPSIDELSLNRPQPSRAPVISTPPTSVQEKIIAAAKQYGVDPQFALRVARQESGFNQNSPQGGINTSSAGALGVMQLMPPTARDLQVDPHNVDQNIEGGVRYLRQMLDKYDNNPQLAAAAYNAGPGRVDQHLRTGAPLPAETQAYIPRVTEGVGVGAPLGIAPQRNGPVYNSPPYERSQEGRRGVDFGSDSKLWPALAAAGFGMMSGTSPYAGVNIGQGALVGMSQYAQDKQRDLAARKLTEELALKRQQMEQHERLATLPYGNLTAAQRATLEHQQATDRRADLQPVKIGTGLYGDVFGIRDPSQPTGFRVLDVDPNTGQFRQAPTPQYRVPGNPQAPETGASAERSAEAPAEDTTIPVHARLTSFNGMNSDKPNAQYNADVLADVDPKIAEQVKAIAEYRKPMPALGRNNPYNRNINELVSQYNPQYNAQLYQTRQRTMNAFSTGIEGRNISSMGMLSKHLEQMAKAAVDLDNTRFAWLNSVTQPVRRATGEKEYQDKLKAYETISELVANEAPKVFVGGSQTALADRDHWRKEFGVNLPLNEQLTALRSLVMAVGGRLEQVGDTYNRGMATDHAPTELLHPKILDVYKRMENINENNAKDLLGGKKTEPPAASSRPESVPQGSLYSPSRNQWKTPDGKILDETGKPVGP